jgi:hypothetical protein
VARTSCRWRISSGGPGRCGAGGVSSLDLSIEFGAAYWNVGQFGGARQGLGDISATPVSRLSAPLGGVLGIFGEAGIGLHYLTRSVSNPDTELSTRFEFGD